MNSAGPVPAFLLMYTYTDRIETERLTTRFLTMEDSGEWERFLGEPDCTKYFPSFMKEEPKKGAVAWMEKQLLRYSEKRYGLQALHEKESGIWVGQCGLLLQEVDGIKELEVGYHLFREHWGRGYAGEAARTFLHYGFTNTTYDSIISVIHKENVASAKVAYSNGLSVEKETVWNSIPVRIFRIGKREFYRLNPALPH